MASSPSKAKAQILQDHSRHTHSLDSDSFDTMEQQNNFSSSVIVLIAKIIITAFIKFWRACTAGVLILLLCFWLYGSWMALSLLVIAILGFVYNAQDMLLYHPEQPDNARIYVESPAVMGLPFENIFIKTKDGEKINLVLIKQPPHLINNAPTVIFFHGNAGNIGHRLLNAHTLFTCGLNVVLVEYRGFGKSSGRPSESGLYKDAEATINYMSKRTDINQGRIVIFGRSLGGAVAMHISSRPYYASKLSCVIVENTFTSIPDIARYLFNFKILRILPTVCYKNKFASSTCVKQVKVPVLFLSGLADTLVPPAMMKSLFDLSASNMKRMAMFEGGTHNETWQCFGYYEAIKRFMQEVNHYQETRGVTTTSAIYKTNLPFNDGGLSFNVNSE